jgi:hypothetical protein
MMYGKREKKMQKLALAALILGCFQTNTAMAWWPFSWAQQPKVEAPAEAPAEDTAAAKEAEEMEEETEGFEEVEEDGVDALNAGNGVDHDALLRIVPDFRIERHGNELKFFGSVPARCVRGDSEYPVGSSKAYDKGTHFVTITLAAECEKEGFVPKKNEKRVRLSQYIHPLTLDDLDGPVHLRRNAGGDGANIVIGQQLKGYIDGELKDLVVVSSETDRQIAEDTAATEKAKARNKQIEDLRKRLGILCKEGDYVGLSEAIDENMEFFEDMSKIHVGIENGRKKKLKNALSKAETADEAIAALDAFREAAAEYGWDEDELNEDYITLRLDLLQTGLSDFKSGDRSADDLAKETEELAREVKSLDRKLFKDKQRDFALVFNDIAVDFVEQAKDGESSNSLGLLKRADDFFTKAKRYTKDSEDLLKMEKEMTESYAELYRACVEEAKESDPLKIARCEKKYLQGSERHADRMGKVLKRDANDSEEGAEAYQAFLQDRRQTFGSGPKMCQKGLGCINVQQPGSTDIYQYQSYQQALMLQYQQMMMMYQQRMMNPYGMYGI